MWEICILNICSSSSKWLHFSYTYIYAIPYYTSHAYVKLHGMVIRNLKSPWRVTCLCKIMKFGFILSIVNHLLTSIRKRVGKSNIHSLWSVSMTYGGAIRFRKLLIMINGIKQMNDTVNAGPSVGPTTNSMSLNAK